MTNNDETDLATNIVDTILTEVGVTPSPLWRQNIIDHVRARFLVGEWHSQAIVVDDDGFEHAPHEEQP